MIVSTHVADVGSAAAFRLKPPDPGTTPGLRSAHVGIAGRLTGRIVPDVMLGRAVMVALWDDDASLDRFLVDGSRLAERLATGWSMRLEPLRAYGSWPGLPADTPSARDLPGEPPSGSTDADAGGPVVVTTLGLLKLRRAIPWTRASNAAQRRLTESDGVIWAMGVASPPRFVATLSVWESAAAAKAYAYEEGAHRSAIAANAATSFMTQEVFARYRPYATSGHLDGHPAIAEDWLLARTSSS